MIMNGWSKTVVIAVVFFTGFLCKTLLAGQEDAERLLKEEIVSKARTLQMPFIANNGQVDEQVRFYAKTFGGTVFVTKKGEIVYSLPSGRDALHASPYHSGHASLYHYSPILRADHAGCPPDRVLTNALLAAYLPVLQKETTRRVASASTPPIKIQDPKSAIPLRGVALKETIVGAKKMGRITGEQPAVTTVNYFTGNDTSKWKTNVPTYNRVNLGEVYEGIELSLKAYGDNVEKLFCVRPGASPEFIKVQLDGSKSLRVNQEGRLEADTELGPVTFTKPVAYQEIDGKRVEVECSYTIVECVHNFEFGWFSLFRISHSEINTFRFQKSQFRIPHSAFGKFRLPKSAIRNPKSEYGFTVASYDTTKDLIIDPLLASTFLGGSGGEDGGSLILDTSGNVYVAGCTSSTDFPTTSGAYDTSFNGDYDVFVSKLDSGLTGLLASTFLGGADYEWGSLTLDTSGNVYVTGSTYSTDFPTTSGAYDTSYSGGDVFVSKLDGNLSANYGCMAESITAAPNKLTIRKTETVM